MLNWFLAMTWYQQAAVAFFLGFLPLVLGFIFLDVLCEPFFWIADIWYDIMWGLGRRDVVVTGGGGGGSAAGGAGMGGRMYVHCSQCARDISASGSCPVCGPAAGVTFGYAVGGAGGSGGSGGANGSNNWNSASFAGYAMGGGGGGGSYAATYCRHCSVSIPSGTICSYACLKAFNGMTPMAGGCADCGSPLAPTYHAGCPQQGRVTSYLPVPGPYGSNGMAAPVAPPKPAKPRIPFSGMSGYSENGTPDDWDMAIGAIRGYRWFKIDIPVSWTGMRTRKIRVGYFDAMGKPEVEDAGMRELGDHELPRLTGAYNGKWEDGVNEAKCARNLATKPGNGFKHEPPETREACGCGYWAYFDPKLPVGNVLTNWRQPTTNDGAWTSIVVLGCVEGTGRVIVGEKGYRSQYAQIVALTLGQVSVPELMWWKEPRPRGASQSYSFDAQGGRIQCSDDEIYKRLAKIEDMLGRIYPSARIVTSEATLRSLFPPDPNYGAS